MLKWKYGPIKILFYTLPNKKCLFENNCVIRIVFKSGKLRKIPILKNYFFFSTIELLLLKTVVNVSEMFADWNWVW